MVTRQATDLAEPVWGVTLYDRVTSFLLSLILTLGGVAAALGVVWVSSRIVLVAPPVSEVVLWPVAADDLGGDPQGLPDEEIDLPGIVGADPSAADEPDRVVSDATDLEKRLPGFIDQIVQNVSTLEEFAGTLDVDRAGLPAGSIGTGMRRELGVGPGRGGGVRAADRWEIIFEPGLTEDEYARQLDYFNVELAAVADAKLYRVSHLSRAQPTVRVVSDGAWTKELFFIWRDENRRRTDLNLLKKAKELPLADNAVVLQFYPRETVLKLTQLERDYAQEHGRTGIRFIAKTRFVVKKTETGYDFEVTRQSYLRE